MLKKIFFGIMIILILNASLNDDRKLLKVEYFFNDVLKINNVLKKEQNISLCNNNALKEEINELKKLLELNTITSEYKIINATVIARNLEEYLDIVTIDKGKKDGIKKDMAVVTNEGLLGKTIKVSNNTSKVKLLTSPDIYNKISIMIQTESKKVYGILSRYEEKTNSFIIEGIDDLAIIKEGDLIYTTGLGEVYPTGILIGKVTRISKDHFDLSYNLKITPSSNFNNFHYVGVLDRGES
jgi:rod shape-determining protein MreC